MLQFINSYNNKKILYFVIIFTFSISINQYYGNLGVCPIDSFWFFNSGYDTLNGHYPFKDYWTIAGPFITLIQAIIFKIFGVSWFSYVLHASFFNFLISISTFYILCNFKLNLNYSFLYALLVSILAYPSAGTPYVDHHASILSVIAIFCFIMALKTKLKIYWFLMPIIIGISFLTKQTPTGHIFIIITILSIIYFIFNFSFTKLFYGFLGSIFIISIFFIILYLGKIPITSFIDQYILFPITIGKVRFEYFLFPLEFSRIVLRFKLIHLSSIILLIVAFKCLKNDFKYLKNEEFLISLSLLGMSYTLIAHQLMTINGMFVFFVIPILVGFSHIYYIKHFKNNNYILAYLLVLSICSTLWYGNKYINKRDFMDLKNANMDDKVNANLLSNKLNGLKWISCLKIKNPKEEISELLNVINIIKKDDRKKMIVTDYQVISVILNIYDYSPSQVWFINHVAFQNNDSVYFKKYKKFLIEHLNRNKTRIVYVIKPLWGGNEVFEKGLDKTCIKKNKVTEILDSYLLKECIDLDY